MTKEQYQSIHIMELRALAKSRGIKRTSTMKKGDLIEAMLALDAEAAAAPAVSESAAESSLRNENAGTAGTVPEGTEVCAAAEERAAGNGDVQGGTEEPYDSRSVRDEAKTETAGEVEKSPANDDRDDLRERIEARVRRGNPESGQAYSTDELRPAGAFGEGGFEAREGFGTRSEAQGEGRTPGDVRERSQGVQRVRKENEFANSGMFTRGILEVMPDGFGFLRSSNFLSGDDDTYVSQSQIRRFNMKTGDMVCGNKRPKAPGEKSGGLLYVASINDRKPDDAKTRAVFEKMTPIFPNERIRLERKDGSKATRIVDLISPIGKGQRGMIVSPPKAGKTTLLKDIAKSIIQADPDMYLMILLIDERPEEVTDMKESVVGDHVEIIYSTFDETPEHHMRVSEMVIERAKRLVEQHSDVVILLDSITRLTRAYNVLVPPSGRTLSGGLDPTALQAPKRFFGAARNMREGGSLTILATALVDTGSKMDDVVYEEFKGTGNMEVILDRKLQERRIFPAIDIVKSGTRREDLLLTEKELKAVNLMRRRINGAKADEAIEQIINAISYYPDNEQVVDAILSKWQN